LRGFKRQALHAESLAFVHPSTGETLRFEAPMPADMLALLGTLRDDTASAAARGVA
ncbi:MAG: RNA pseudouridine synthase, partial [Lysobacteraceae bacterium]